MADSSQVGDIGTKILLDSIEDISSANDQKIMFKKPDGISTGEWQGEKEGSHYVYYLTEADDLDQAGDWCLQIWVETVSGIWTGRGERWCYTVEKNCA